MGTDDPDGQFKEFLKTAQRIVREEKRRRGADHAFFDAPVAADSPELTVDYLDEVARRRSPLRLHDIEETYECVLLSYLRMKGNVSALDRLVHAMREAFDLTELDEIGQI